MIDGGDGLDTVHIDGLAADFTFMLVGDSVEVASDDDSCTLTNVEYLAFDDGNGTTSIIDVNTLISGGTLGQVAYVGTGNSSSFAGSANNDMIFFTGGTENTVDDAGGTEDRIVFSEDVSAFTIVGDNDNYTIVNHANERER